MTSSGLQFEQPIWHLCDEGLRFVNDREPSIQPPSEKGDWPPLGSGTKARLACEEVLESILVLNLRTILEEQEQFLFRGGDYWGVQDITALDSIGRIHLFELKRNILAKEVPEQLGMYLLRALYESPREAVDQWWRSQRRDLDATRWERYLFGALANEATWNIGRTFVNQWHDAIRSGECVPISKGAWKKLCAEGKAGELLNAALSGKARFREVDMPNRQILAERARTIYDELGTPPPVLPSYCFDEKTSRAVVWLVARDFQPDAFEQVRRWRRSGVDARCLRVDARQSTRNGRWNVSVRREHYPQRTYILNRLAAVLASEPDRFAGMIVRLQLYDVRTPSDKKIGQGGTPLLDQARAIVTNEGGDVVYSIDSAG